MSWNMCENPKDFLDLFLEIQHDPEFWLNLPPIPHSHRFFQNGFCFIPEVYITRRAVPSEVTAEWLERNGFPKAEVLTVAETHEKAELVKARCDVFVDDLIETVKGIRDEGGNAVLFEAPYQRGHDTLGLPKIKDLSELCVGGNNARNTRT